MSMEPITNKPEPGAEFQGTSCIRLEMIEPTVRSFLLHLDILNSGVCYIGSTGKKPVSGDIDLAIADSWDQNQICSKMESLYEVRKRGKRLSALVPIYESQEKVQIDLIFGPMPWTRHYYHSPRPEDSQYKGYHRNLALGTFVSHFNRLESPLLDGLGRPEEVVQWKYTCDGLYRVFRKARYERGKTLKKHYEVNLDSPIVNFKEMTHILTGEADENLFDSLESVINTVKVYRPEMYEKFCQSLLDKFAELKDPYPVPKTLTEHLSNEIWGNREENTE